MKTIQVYQELKQKVSFFYQKLKLFKYEKTKGRKLAIPIIDTITLSLYRQASSRATKKSLWNDFRKTLKCSYKTLVVNINKSSILCLQRKNMKKVITFFQKKLYDTRMIIELNFRNLKMLYNLVSSFPRTINGYMANYIHSIVAYALR